MGNIPHARQTARAFHLMKLPASPLMNLPETYRTAPDKVKPVAYAAVLNGWKVEISDMDGFWYVSLSDGLRCISIHHFTRKGRKVTNCFQKWFHCPLTEAERVTWEAVTWNANRPALT